MLAVKVPTAVGVPIGIAIFHCDTDAAARQKNGMTNAMRNGVASATGLARSDKHVVPGRTVEIFAWACQYAQACEAKIVTQPVASQASTNIDSE